MRYIKFFTILFVSLSFWGLISISSAQVIEGDISLTTQAEVDSFSGTSITGSLYIKGNDITDLTPLSSLTSVGDDLEIGNNAALTTLDGLNNINSVGYNLVVIDNPVLTNLDGLINVTSVGHILEVRYNDTLTTLDGLSNITSVGSNLSVNGNSSLNSFCGLYSLLSNNGLGGGYFVSGNLLNPTQQQIIDDGPCTASQIEENDINQVLSYKLLQNYPNPFNPQTTIAFNVKEYTAVSLKLYNIRGQLVSILVDKRMQPGQYKVQFDSGDLASGVYLYQIKMGKYQSVKKMILLQ